MQGTGKLVWLWQHQCRKREAVSKNLIERPAPYADMPLHRCRNVCGALQTLHKGAWLLISVCMSPTSVDPDSSKLVPAFAQLTCFNGGVYMWEPGPNRTLSSLKQMVAAHAGATLEDLEVCVRACV